MSEVTERDLVNYRKTLTDRFDDSELSTLCFDLGVDYQSLPGTSKADKARELVAYLERRGLVPELVKAGEKLRPDIPWQTISGGRYDDSPPVVSEHQVRVAESTLRAVGSHMTEKRWFFVGHVFDQSSIDDLRSAISMACKSSEWTPLYADDRIIDGHILSDKIVPDLQLSEFCLFEISDRTRPNVFLELGLAKGMGKPCILLIRRGAEEPSDLGGYDRLIYGSYKELANRLRRIFASPPMAGNTNNKNLPKSSDRPNPENHVHVYESGVGVSFVDEVLQPARFNASFLGLCGNPIEAASGAWEMIRKKANAGCQFRFLHMNPSSAILQLRSAEEDGLPTSRRLSLQAEATRESLMKLKNSVTIPSNIEIGAYDRIPTVSVVRIDNHVYVGPYLFGLRGIDTSWFDFTRDENPRLFQKYADLFQRLWDDVNTQVI